MKIKKEQSLRFLQFMKANEILPSDIFFTDESVFNLSSYNAGISK